MSPIRAVFIDAGNTLFTERRSRASIYATVARSFGGETNESDAADSMGHAFAEMPTAQDGAFRYSTGWFEAFNHRVLRELGVSEVRWEKAHLELLQRFESPKTYKLFKEVPTVVEKLSNLGVTVGVVSNWSERLPVLREGLGIRDCFDFIVTSAEMKSEKPERNIFERALFRAGVPGEEALHVGDHPERDVRGACEAGLRAALLDRNSEDGNTTREGIPVLSDLHGILPLVEQMQHASHS